MELVFPSIEYKQAVLEYVQEHTDHGETKIQGSSGLDHAESYEEWLEKVIWNQTESSPDWVPNSTYFGVVDRKIVGMTNIRHHLNEFLLNTWGHIGYGVRPSERRKGYATQMLSLALIECRTFGIDKALVSCDKDNIASAKTILKNGGVLGKEIVQEDGSIVQQYWIPVISSVAH